MKIWTAWAETESGFDLVAAGTDDDYYSGHFDTQVEQKSFDYEMYPRVLCLDVDDNLITELFASGDTEGTPNDQL